MNHSEKCIYNDDDMLLYCIMKLDKHDILLSAREAQVFDEYLAYARNNDEGLHIDMDAADNEPFSIVYGGVMLKHDDLDGAVELIEKLKSYAFLDLDRDKDVLSASAYEDIRLFPQLGKVENFIPFAALMKTTHPFDNENISVTMFPLNKGNLVWECMANKPFLLACRKKVTAKDGTTASNWTDQIDSKAMVDAYRVADLYTGPAEED